jgi:hypothetical protein
VRPDNYFKVNVGEDAPAMGCFPFASSDPESVRTAWQEATEAHAHVGGRISAWAYPGRGPWEACALVGAS